ncbi:hypothetical protein BKI52_12505 [marine bacterium AO1-C]|nr:hypothetical protein BKI52_12505 [marine bacterium AO1-C]
MANHLKKYQKELEQMLRNGDTMERLELALVDEQARTELTQKESELLLRLEYAASQLQVKKYADVVKLVANGLPGSFTKISRDYARKIIKEAKVFFPDLHTIDQDARRMSSVSFYDRIAEAAFKDKNYSDAIRAKEKADKLAGLGENESGQALPEGAFNPGKAIMIPLLAQVKGIETADKTDKTAAFAQFDKLLKGYEENEAGTSAEEVDQDQNEEGKEVE